MTKSSVVETTEPILNVAGNPAVAHTATIAGRMTVTVQAGLPPAEASVKLYHEMIEAAAVGRSVVPEAAASLSHAEIEALAVRSYAELGPATVDNLSTVLQSNGFTY